MQFVVVERRKDGWWSKLIKQGTVYTHEARFKMTVSLAARPREACFFLRTGTSAAGHYEEAKIQHSPSCAGSVSPMRR